MASSATEICNLTISWLAGNSILSLNDDSEEARLCKANYDPGRRAVLEEREWTFAVKRVQLPALAEPPLFGWKFKFLVPPDLLYSIGVYDPGHANIKKPPQMEHVVEGREILADKSIINLKYISDVTNTQQFSPLFDQALAAYIGINIAIPLTENAVQFDRMAGLYDIKLNDAIASNSLQGTREQLQQSQLEQSRRIFTPPA